jgi:hypothetical protein
MPPEADAVKIVMTSSKYDLVDLDYIYYREDHCGVKFIFLLKKTFSPGTLVSSTNKTDRHDITEILFKVKQVKKLNTITPH